MGESYCGKLCTDCSYKEKLECKGCKNGPGSGFYCDCELAKCCKKCGHETCNTCVKISTCRLHKDRTKAAELRLKRRDERNAERERLLALAPGMIKCFRVLFVCLIIGAAVSLLFDDLFIKNFLALKIIGISLFVVVQLVYYITLLRMSAAEDSYKGAAWLGIIAIIAYLPINILIAYSEKYSVFTVMNLVISGIMILSRYSECNAHSALLSKVSVMSDKWELHWKWFLRITIVKIASVLLAFISPILAAVLLLVALIAGYVVDVQRIVYIYMSKEDFTAIYNERSK